MVLKKSNMATLPQCRAFTGATRSGPAPSPSSDPLPLKAAGAALIQGPAWPALKHLKRFTFS